MKYQVSELGSTDAREVARNPQDGEFESSDSSSDVGDDIGSRIEQIKADEAIKPSDMDIFSSSKSSDSDIMAL